MTFEDPKVREALRRDVLAIFETVARGQTSYSRMADLGDRFNGSKGGQAKGPRKARSPEQYREMARKSAEVRKKNASLKADEKPR